MLLHIQQQVWNISKKKKNNNKTQTNKNKNKKKEQNKNKQNNKTNHPPTHLTPIHPHTPPFLNLV